MDGDSSKTNLREQAGGDSVVSRLNCLTASEELPCNGSITFWVQFAFRKPMDFHLLIPSRLGTVATVASEVGAAIAGRITPAMRKALVKEGQAPHTAIIGCADSRAPLETVFDAMPGDIFVLRNAGNTCTHAEGSVVGSLEFCIGALGTKILVVSLA